jgi:acyl carrier protein
MTEPEVYERLTEVFREVFADDAIALKAETSAKDIDGWDSFTHLNLIVAVEMRFRIKILTSEIEGLRNVGDLVRLISNRVA